MKLVSIYIYNNIIDNYGLIEIFVIIWYKCLSWKFFLKNIYGGIFYSCIFKFLMLIGNNSIIFDCSIW